MTDAVDCRVLTPFPGAAAGARAQGMNQVEPEAMAAQVDMWDEVQRFREAWSEYTV